VGLHFLTADGAAGYISCRAADQTSADHLAEAAASHHADAATQRSPCHRTLLARGHTLASAEQPRHGDQKNQSAHCFALFGISR
jgi:hypothetical protein